MDVLKTPNPYGGQWKNLTKEQYYEMDSSDKRMYHSARFSHYEGQLKRMLVPRKLANTPLPSDEDIRALRVLSRFHSRQRLRLSGGTKSTFYSKEEEDNRRYMRPQYDAVDKLPEITEEEYNNLSRKDKMLYWARLRQKTTGARRAQEKPVVIATAARYLDRMIKNPNYTAPFKIVPKSSEDTVAYRQLTGTGRIMINDADEYKALSDVDKRKYHNSLTTYYYSHDKDLYRFHGKMLYRLKHGSKLPTYFSPEEEP